MASLALLFRRRSLCPARRRRQLRFASSNSEIAWNLHARMCSQKKHTTTRRSAHACYSHQSKGLPLTDYVWSNVYSRVKLNMNRPAALLAEALLGAEDDDPGRLGVRLAHLVPPVVLLGVRQRQVAPLHLAPRHGRRGRRLVLPLTLSSCATSAAIAVDLRRLVARRPCPAAGGPLPQLEAGKLLLLQLQGLRRVGRHYGGCPVHGEIPGRCRASATAARATVSFHSYTCCAAGPRVVVEGRAQDKVEARRRRRRLMMLLLEVQPVCYPRWRGVAPHIKQPGSETSLPGRS
uniref:Uncharacterized protein n=1 Tax=Zea mays TaxID=4577 RepID=A0A804RKN6_MAIZE